ncbi:hypothetical protein Taro_047853 [Colocasia esculenta]|uniref:Flotillin-like n=1 Tax=Colocasia esculenta TaxID=4460 RepID=A0A843X1S6_COLES|nr:hypothetical protein [Colocasia esculenta]
MVITGYDIDDIKLGRKTCIVFDISPVNYTFEVQAMSVQKLTFLLPTVLTIGPRIDDRDNLLRYAKLISQQANHVKELVEGVIEGESHVLAASMTMEEIFCSTKFSLFSSLGHTFPPPSSLLPLLLSLSLSL